MTDPDPEAPYGRNKRTGLPNKPNRWQKGGPDYRPPRSTKEDKSGPGLHGPAQGASTSRLTSDNAVELNRLRNDPDLKAARAARKERMVRRMEDMAYEAELEQTQLQAAVAAAKFLDDTPTKVQLSGDAQNPVETKITVEFIRPKG